MISFNLQSDLPWIFTILPILICIISILYYSFDLAVKSKHNEVPKEPKIYQKAAVASSGQFCEQYVIDVFQKGGSVADAAIVALSLQGLTSPQSLGVGGGFLLLHYDRSNTKIEVLNAREYSPSKTTKDMFLKSQNVTLGGLSSAVPGEFQGYWELHQKYGKLPWCSLFQPAITLCKEGIPVNAQLANALSKMRVCIMSSPTLKEIFCNPATGNVYCDGDFYTIPILAKTFEKIAKEGVDAFYRGSLTENFVQDIRENGGIISVSDMDEYRAKWCDPIFLDIPKNRRIFTAPNPSSGQAFLSILDVIFRLGASDSPATNWFRMIEAWKHAFGHRSTLDGPHLKDEPVRDEYEPKMAELIAQIVGKDQNTSLDVRHYTRSFEKVYHDGGTCHMCLLAPNGDAVSVTSSVNFALGAQYASKSTGIIMNNHMMDFAIPGYSDKIYIANQLEPKKQPVSCMVPSLIIDNKSKNVKMIVGAAGGFKILTAASQLVLEILLHEIPQEIAINHRRLHHQLIPMVLFHEQEFPNSLLEELKKFGHHVEKIPPGSSAAVITVSKNGIRADGDQRRLGSSAGY